MRTNCVQSLLVLAALSAAGCDNNHRAETSADTPTLKRVIDSKTLRVSYIEYPPIIYRNAKSSSVDGLFADILREIASQIAPGVNIQFEETNWADFSATLISKRADLCVAGTFATIPRAMRVSFTRPIIYLGRSAIIKKNDERFQAALGVAQFDRADLRIGVVNGEGSHEYAKTHFKKLGADGLVVFEGADLTQCLAAVSSGQVDVGLSDAMETTKYAKLHPDVLDLFGTQPYDLTPIAWSVRQEDEAWRHFLDTAIHLLQAQGRIEELSREHGNYWTLPERPFAVGR